MLTGCDSHRTVSDLHLTGMKLTREIPELSNSVDQWFDEDFPKMFPSYVYKKFHFSFGTNEFLISGRGFLDAASEMKEAFSCHIFSFQLFCDVKNLLALFWFSFDIGIQIGLFDLVKTWKHKQLGNIGNFKILRTWKQNYKFENKNNLGNIIIYLKP